MTKIYILTLEGEPQYATTDLNVIYQECVNWFNEHLTSYGITRDFDYWVEDRDYPNTEEGEEQAWKDYIESEFENGTWGDYAWYESYLK